MSRNPAVPPPPVAGATAGGGLADGLGAGAVCVADGDTAPLAEGLALPLAELLDERSGLGEVGPAGENDVCTGEGADPVQAETAAEARMVMVLQPITASLALSPIPALVVRTFMEPPHASGTWRLVPGPRHEKPATGNENGPAAAAPAEDSLWKRRRA